MQTWQWEILASASVCHDLTLVFPDMHGQPYCHQQVPWVETPARWWFTRKKSQGSSSQNWHEKRAKGMPNNWNHQTGERTEPEGSRSNNSADSLIYLVLNIIATTKPWTCKQRQSCTTLFDLFAVHFHVGFRTWHAYVLQLSNELERLNKKVWTKYKNMCSSLGWTNLTMDAEVNVHQVAAFCTFLIPCVADWYRWLINKAQDCLWYNYSKEKRCKMYSNQPEIGK